MFHKYEWLDKKMWNDWEEGIILALTKRAFIDAWNLIKNDTRFSQTGDFDQFVEDSIKNPSKSTS